MIQPFFKLLDHCNVTTFKPADVAAVISARPSGTYLEQQLARVSQDGTFAPELVNQFLSDKLTDLKSHGRVSIKATAMAYVFCILCHMSCGEAGGKLDRAALWATHDATKDMPKERTSSFLGIDLTSSQRFEKVADPVDPLLYLQGYHLEDWNRAWVLFNYTRNFCEKPWNLFKKSREPAMLKLYWANINATRVKQRKDYQKSKATVDERMAYTKLFKDLQEKATASSVEGEGDFLASLLAQDPSKFSEHQFHKVREDVTRLLRQHHSFLKTATGKSAKPKDLPDILADWENIKTALSPHMPIPRGADEDDFVPNPHFKDFGGKAAQDFLANSNQAIERIADSLRTRLLAGGTSAGDALDNKEVPNQPHFDKAAEIIEMFFALSTMTSGKTPPNVDYNHVLDAFGFQGEARQTLEFNVENTRITKAMANQLSCAAPQTSAAADEEDDEEVLQEAFRFLRHQPVGMLPFPVSLTCPS